MAKERRNVLKTMLVTASLSTVLPVRWTKPVIESVILPVHAQTSPACADSQSNGFAGPYAGSNWNIVNNGGSAVFNGTSSLVLTSGADEGVSASISMDGCGSLSFDYDYVLDTNIIVDVFIVDLNGSTIVELDFSDNSSSTAGNGDVMENVEPGWQLVLNLLGDGFQTGGQDSVITITNFSAPVG